MAEQNPNTGGNFVQQTNLFAAEGPFTQLITNVYEFSDNLSDVIEDIVSFLRIASVFLKALKSPLEFILLPVIESLETYILDLKNIGAGVLTVWPWEVGTNPSPIDFSALLNGFQKFQDYYSSNESSSTKLTADVQIQQQLEQNSSAYVGVKRLVDSETLLSEGSPNTKEEILSNYQSLKNFLDLDSSYWDENPTIQEGLKLTKNILNAKQLTPAQVIDKIVSSFDDINDPQRPTGTGDYTAFVMIATLPALSAINQVISSFSNFFGGVLDRVTPNGKELAKRVVMEEIIDLGLPVLPKNTSKDEEKYFFNQVRVLDNLPDGTYKTGNAIIPMFEKGDLITQTQESFFTQSFSAEVIKHNDIIIRDGVLIENTVLVKDVNGKIIKKHSNKKDSNPGIVRRNSNVEDITKHPMFLPGDSSKADFKQEKYSILATIEPNKLELKEVFPDVPEIKKIKNAAKNGDDIYNNSYLYNERLVQKMIDFAKTLSVGKTLHHPFLKTSENESSLNSEDGGSIIDQTKQLLDFLPGAGLNYHIKEILVENTETGAIKPLEYRDIERELFRFSEVEDSEKKNVEEKIIGMNKLILKLGTLKEDGSITDASASAKEGISPPGKIEFFKFSDILSDNRANPSIALKGKVSNLSGTPPNWKFYKITDFLPIYGELIDNVVKIIQSVKGWIKTSTDLIDEAIKFLDDFAKWLNDINQSILEALRLLTLGLNAAGLYTLSLSGNGGPSDFKAKLRKAKFLQKKANPYPSMELETVEKSETVTNPITGLDDVIVTKTLKPVLIPADRENTTPQPISPSDMDHLKYSLGIVFYAQGNDSAGLDKFLTNFSVAETFVNAFIGNFNGSDTILEKIKPYIYDIQVSNSDGEFVSAENAVIDSDFKIRVIFTNDGHLFTEEEIQALNAIQGRTVDTKPSVITSNLHLSKEDVDNGLAEFTLTKDGNQILFNNPPSVSITTGGDGRVFYNLDFTTVESLSASEAGDASYIFTAVSNPLVTNERIEITESKTLTSGFKIKQTSILDVEINYAI